jgi:hypothetical protein
MPYRSWLWPLLSRSLLAAACSVHAGAESYPRAAEETMVVRAEGRAPGTGLAAREQAIADAQQEILRQSLETLLGSKDLDAVEPVLRHASGYIARYDLLRHDTLGEQTRVEIDGHVLVRALHRDVAGLMLPRLPRLPTIQLLIGEKLGPAQLITVPDFGVTEVQLSDRLKRAQVEVRGADTLGRNFPQAALIDIVQGDVAAGADFARSQTADVVAIGTAIATTDGEPAPGKLLRTRVELTLRIFRTRDGKMIDELSSASVVHGADPWTNGEEAAQDAATRLAGSLLDAATLAALSAAPPNAVLMTVHAPGSPQRVAALQQYLLAQDPIRAVEQIYYSDSLARLRIAYDGSMAHLSDFLAPVVAEGRKLEILRVVGREIEVSFAP